MAPFASHSSSESSSSVIWPEERKKQQLLQDISDISGQIESAKTELSSYTVSKENAAAADTELKAILSEIGRQSSRLQEVSNLKADHEKSVAELESSIAENRKLHDDLDSACVAIKADIDNLDSRKEKLYAEFEGIKKAIIDAFEKSKANQALEISNNETVIGNLQAKREAMQKDIEASRLILSGLASEISTGVSGKQALKASIAEAQSHLESIDASSEKAKEAHAVLLNAQEKELASRLQDIVNRDGAASDREAWNAKKEAGLRLAKSELEQFYGRKITTVMFEDEK